MNPDRLLQSLISQGYITQSEFDNKVNQYQQQMASTPTGINKVIVDGLKWNLSTVQQEIDIETKINNGEITPTIYSSMSTDEQNLVRLVLFKKYSPQIVDVPKRLSAIEFLLVPLVKLMDKTMDKTKLTTDEQNFFDGVLNVINSNDMPVNDLTDWRYLYFQSEFEGVQQTRATYFTERNNIIGS